MIKNLKANAGFTLIEILIVISIIGLLSAATLIGLGAFRGQGRDARRLSDLRQIQNGLELIYAKMGAYPDDISNVTFSAANIGVSSVPKDPGTGVAYQYSKTSCLKYSYMLAATLDADVTSNIYKDSAMPDCGMACASCSAGGSTPCSSNSSKVYCIGF
jgi:prepilin-type N-terminal cleavage/methylation domain-containing protein